MSSSHVEAALAAEEARAFTLAMRVRVAALLVTTILVPNPLDEIDNPIAQRLRFDNEVYFFAVLGDTVNVASRLERLTRTLGGPIVASDDLVRTIHAQTDEAEANGLLADLASAPSVTLRGREGTPLDVWIGPTEAPAITAPSGDPA